MSTKGIFKHIEESDSPKSDVKELREFLKPAMQIKDNEFVWRVLPNGDWVRVR